MRKRYFNDHQLAEYLQNERVIDNWDTIEHPPVNEYWRDDELIVVIVFDNETMETCIYTYN